MVLAAIFFGSWLAITIVAQLGGRARAWIRAHDCFALVPSWWFYGEHLGANAFEVEIEHAPGEWRAIAGKGGVFWSPARRVKQRTSDAAVELLERGGDRDAERALEEQAGRRRYRIVELPNREVRFTSPEVR